MRQRSEIAVARVCSTSRQGRTNELRHEFSNRCPPFDLIVTDRRRSRTCLVEEKSHILDERRVRFVPKGTSRRAMVGTLPAWPVATRVRVTCGKDAEDRLRLWLERSGAGFACATPRPVSSCAARIRASA